MMIYDLQRGDLAKFIKDPRTLRAFEQMAAKTGVAPGSYGDGSHLLAITIDANGRVTSVEAIDLTTDGVTEASNLYFTQARARDSVSGGTGIDYDGATGEIAADVAYFDGRYDPLQTGVRASIRTVTSAPTIGVADQTLLCDATAASFVIPLPSAASMVNRILVVKKIDASVNTVTIDPNGAELIDGAASVVISVLNDSYTIQSNGSGWWVL